MIKEDVFNGIYIYHVANMRIKKRIPLLFGKNTKNGNKPILNYQKKCWGRTIRRKIDSYRVSILKKSCREGISTDKIITELM